MTDIEKRTLLIENLRSVRAADDPESGKRKFVGYAAVFNSETRINSWLIEKIAPGAFTESIQNDDIRSVWNHNNDFVLARTTNGTLKLTEDEKGLLAEIDPPDTQWARDFQVSIDRGDVSQMSFSFRTISDKWEENQEDNTETRTLLKAKLFEVSPVTFPAYADTTVALRSLESARGSNHKTKMPDYSHLKEEDALFKIIMGV
jgi:hypothetical protein